MGQPKDKHYFVVSGSHNDSWRLNVLQFSEDRYYPGNYGVTTYWNNYKEFSDLQSLIEAINSLELPYEDTKGGG